MPWLVGAAVTAAKDEMGCLLGELRELLAQGGQPVPAFERLAELGSPK